MSDNGLDKLNNTANNKATIIDKWLTSSKLALNPSQTSFMLFSPEVESSRTSSRTHFEVIGLGLGLEGQVLGLGLEASSPRKLPCPRLEDSTIFRTVEFRWKTPETSQKICEHLLVFLAWSIGVAKGRGTGGPPPPQLKLHQWQNVTKKPIVSSVSVSFLHFSLTTV